jgi:hypothetical protein
MQDLILEATNVTPQARFETNGQLLLKGRSMVFDVHLFYQPLIDWVHQLEIPTVDFHIDFDYLNSGSQKKILELLKILDSKSGIKQFNVIWLYETDDEDILEMGQLFEEKLLKARFWFKEYAEV